MKENNWAFMLRLLERYPENISMDRLGEYITQFAELLGTDNKPRFGGIERASTGLKANIPKERQHYAYSRIVEAKNNTSSRPGRHLQSLAKLMGEDSIESAEIQDAAGNVIYLINGKTKAQEKYDRLYQSGLIDGMVTGIIGADDTMHLHLCDHFDHDIKLILRDENLARELLLKFRDGKVRLTVHGYWMRTPSGWIPEPNKCTIDKYEILDETPISLLFRSIAEIPNNEWATIKEPIAAWENIRGIN